MSALVRTDAQFSIVEIPESVADAECWTWGTVMYHNDEGDVVGYGQFRRLGAGACELMTDFSPSGVDLLSPSLQGEGA